MRFTTHLLPSRSGNLGIVLLNNPKPLHALNLEMCHCLQDVLKQWYQDDSLAAILVKSNNTESKIPAFCAGGDVKQVYLSGVASQTMDESNHQHHPAKKILHGQGVPGVPTAEFFRQEYYCNHMLAMANKPQISLWDGLVMGGGVGLSVHGKYRVATERTVWAMPETAIGLFPDVGSTYWMPRLLRPSMANYLALTGTRLGARDLFDLGIATHYVSSSRLSELEDALVLATQKLKATATMTDPVAPVLMSFHETPKGAPQLDKPAIERAFGGDHSQTMEGIVQHLQGIQDTEFGRTTLETIRKMSPISLKVTLEALRRGQSVVSITEALQMEFRLAQACMREGSDFFEGIRAVLIDKDQRPVWNPATLFDVSEERVESYFAPIQHEWELPPELVVPSTTTSKL